MRTTCTFMLAVAALQPGLATACIAQTSKAEARYSAIAIYAPPTWFESYFSAALISPTGTRALNYAGGARLVDLTTGQESPDPAWKGLDVVSSVTFGADGEVLLRGQIGSLSGLFRQDSAGRPALIALPSGAGDPQWSPDGRKIAVMQLRLPDSALAAGEPGHLRSYAVPKPVAFTWLPTNESLLVLATDSSARSTLVRLDLESGRTTLVASDLDAGPRPRGLGVSSDGRRAYMALASAHVPAAAVRNRPYAPRAFGIYEINLSTGARRVFVPPPERGDYIAPTVAAGRLFWTHNEANASTVIVPIHGGDARVVIRGAEGPSWRPDGRQIGVFYGEWRQADWAIDWDGGVVDVDATGGATSALIPLITGYGEDFPPIWSPNGKWIAFHSHRSAKPVAVYGAPASADDIWLRRATAIPGVATEIRLTDFGWEVGSPDWSRDGTQLLFTSWERGRPFESVPWTVTIDTISGQPLSHARLPLPADIHGAEWAAWSPVSDSIALEVQADKGRHAVWIVAANGSGGRKLIEYPMNTYGGLCWTPDGRSIVYAAEVGERMQLLSITTAGGEPRQLTHDAANVFQPRVSPDGRFIAATRIEHRREILRRSLR